MKYAIYFTKCSTAGNGSTAPNAPRGNNSKISSDNGYINGAALTQHEQQLTMNNVKHSTVTESHLNAKKKPKPHTHLKSV